MAGPRVRCKNCGDMIQGDRENDHQICTCGRISVHWRGIDYQIDYPDEPSEEWLEIVDEGTPFHQMVSLINFIQDRLLELGYAAQADDIAAVLDAEREYMYRHDEGEDQ